MTKEGIWTIDEKKESKILRKKLADYDFNKFSKKETNDLIRRMREAMKKELSAVREKVGAPGASRRAALEILSLLR